MGIDEYLESKRTKIESSIYSEIPKEPEYIYQMLREFIGRGGKRIRPILVLATAEASSGRQEDALHYALAIELFHNFSLIHDDVEDSSTLRRGAPTLNSEYGIPTAVNAGDAMYQVMWETLLKGNDSPQRLVPALKIMMKSFSSVLDGQGTELYWQRSGNFGVSEEEYFQMAQGKTGALLGLACRLGAYSARAPEEVQLGLAQFGETLGIAFQIKDDILNLTTPNSEYSKEVGEDIRSGKRTLIMIKLLSSFEGAEKEKLLSVLRGEKSSPEDISWAISLAQERGAIDYASRVSERFLLDAKKHLNCLGEDEQKTLWSLAEFAVRKKG